MYTMFLAPDAEGYTSTDGEEWVQSKVDGGAGRYRRDKYGATKRINVQWTLNPAQFQYWRAFWRTVGSDKFLCPLVSEDGTGAKDHEVNIIPGTVNLPRQIGLTYVQQCQLEAKPLIVDPEDDLAILALFEATGGFPDALYGSLAHIVTVVMPEYIGA
jgi:hypothetical protein